MFDFRPSPYIATRGNYWGEEIVRGDRLTKANPFRWDSVVMNLPGKNEHDPRKPCVYKINKATGRIAADFFTFVDDVRVVGGKSQGMYQCQLYDSYIGNLFGRVECIQQD